MLKWEWKMSRALVCIKYLIFSQWEVSGKGPYNKYYERQFHHWTRLLMTSFALTETLQMQPLHFCGPIRQPHSSWRANSCFCNAEEWVGAMIVSFSLSVSPNSPDLGRLERILCAMKGICGSCVILAGKMTILSNYLEYMNSRKWRKCSLPSKEMSASCLSVTSL